MLISFIGFYAVRTVLSSYNWAATSVILQFLQILGLFYKYPLNWPVSLEQLLSGISLININFDSGVGINCAFQVFTSGFLFSYLSFSFYE